MNSLFILYRILTKRLALFDRESQSFTLQLLYNILYHLSVASNISYSLLFAAELREGITKQPITYV